MVSSPRNPDRLTKPLASRYGALFLLLVLTILIYSFVDKHEIMRWILDFSAVVLLAFALRAISTTRGAFIGTLVLGILSIITGAVAGSFAVELAYPFGAGIRALFLGFLVTTIFLDIVRRERVTMDVVLGACCVYLLLGLAWGSLFSLAEWVEPNSFEHINHAASVDQAPGRMSEAELVYFSMITMTTVGYGDIHPQEPPARTLAALEAFMSQLFLAIVIARFIALAITSKGPNTS